MQIKSAYSLVLTATGLIAASAGALTARAQSSEALLDKLVQKGILTPDEAKSLRSESDKDFSKHFNSNMGLPDWVTSFKVNGDFRGRLDYRGSDNALSVDRLLPRYRVRLGVVAELKDDYEVGLTLGSGDSTGNPLSNNTTLDNNGSKKPIWVDKAYAKWTPLHDGAWSASATLGKMGNPFAVSPMVIDPDYTPEGVAAHLGYKIDDHHRIGFTGGVFALSERAISSHHAFMAGGQAIWDAKWNSKVESSLGVGLFGISSPSSLATPPSPTNPTVPDINVGNSRDGGGNLLHNYTPYIVSGSVTYKAETFPFYPGVFPIKLAGEYMQNTGAATKNLGYSAGITFGKAAKRGSWDISWRYQRLEADAWYEELVDDDNAGYYEVMQTGGRMGFIGGTNVKGHLVKLNYAITDALTFTFTGYFNELINPSPAGSKSGGTHLLADLMWKF